MKLHFDREAFEAMILSVNDQEGIRPDIIEKDYYVCLLLFELSKKQKDLKAYFKGGTALYKALACMNRFSEDIDLTVCVDDCGSNNQKQKRLIQSSQEFKSINRDMEDPENHNSRGSITAVYNYETIIGSTIPDPLQRFGRVKVEATSFTVSEPVEPITISPVLFEKAPPEQQEILQNEYGIHPFPLLTITLERIFIDKVFAAEFYYQRYKQLSTPEANQFGFDVTKHVYDLMFLFKHERIIRLLDNPDALQQLVSLKRMEEGKRSGGVSESLSISDFSYITRLLDDHSFRAEYSRMQDIYVFNEKDKIPLEEARLVFEAIRNIPG